jgi:hypothetical protein
VISAAGAGVEALLKVRDPTVHAGQEPVQVFAAGRPRRVQQASCFLNIQVVLLGCGSVMSAKCDERVERVGPLMAFLEIHDDRHSVRVGSTASMRCIDSADRESTHS